MVTLEVIGDALIFISGAILLVVSIVFLRLYNRYSKRDHLLMGLAIFCASFQMVITEFDIFFDDLGDSGLLDFIAGLFSFFTALVIVYLLLYPEKISPNFEEDLIAKNPEL